MTRWSGESLIWSHHNALLITHSVTSRGSKEINVKTSLYKTIIPGMYIVTRANNGSTATSLISRCVSMYSSHQCYCMSRCLCLNMSVNMSLSCCVSLSYAVSTCLIDVSLTEVSWSSTLCIPACMSLSSSILHCFLRFHYVSFRRSILRSR